MPLPPIVGPRPLSGNDRPTCMYCGRPLPADFTYNYQANSSQASSRTFTGYGYLSNGFFCSLSHGFNFAVLIAKKAKLGKA